MSPIHGLAYFLELADGFIEQAHLPEGNAQVVVGFGIFAFGGTTVLEFLLQFAEHSGYVDAGQAGFGSRRRCGRERPGLSDEGSRCSRRISARCRRGHGRRCGRGRRRHGSTDRPFRHWLRLRRGRDLGMEWDWRSRCVA